MSYSLCKFEAQNVYEEFYKYKELFDFSNFKEDSKYYNNANNLGVGKREDETWDVPKSLKCIPS